MRLAFVIFALVALQRLAELVYARRNTRALKQRGGIETGADHYPFIVLLHVSWLIAVWLGIRRDPTIHWFPLSVFVLLQPMRIWIIATLGDYWTTRIITVPGEPLVRRGPYRWLRHPNYVIVALELAVFPLVFGQVRNAIVFSAVNLVVLRLRLKHENRALAPRRSVSSTPPDGLSGRN